MEEVGNVQLDRGGFRETKVLPNNPEEIPKEVEFGWEDGTGELRWVHKWCLSGGDRGRSPADDIAAGVVAEVGLRDS